VHEHIDLLYGLEVQKHLGDIPALITHRDARRLISRPSAASAGARLLVSFEQAQLTQRLDDGRYALGVEVARLHAVYAAIRERGYYAGIGDRASELAGISAPVFHADGRLAALTLTMPTHRYDERHV